MVARIARTGLLGIIMACSLALSFALSGCGTPENDTGVSATETAKAAFEVAKESVATEAPDAKLLIITTNRVVEPTATPVWQFLVGSPKSGMTHAVIVSEGQALPTPYTTSTLSAEEWAAVPSLDDIAIDSDEAYRKALEAYPDGADDVYVINLMTADPGVAATSLLKPMTWVVMFDPTKASDEQTSTVEVDARTGAVTVPK